MNAKPSVNNKLQRAFGMQVNALPSDNTNDPSGFQIPRDHQTISKRVYYTGSCKFQAACVDSQIAYPVLFIERSWSAVSALQEPFFSEILIEVHKMDCVRLKN